MGVAWVPITLLAAASQAVRNALQRALKGRLSTNGAAFTRFVFGLPLAAVYLTGLVTAGVGPLPRPHPTFWAWVVAAGLSQIVAYAKTEVVQAALFEILFLGAVLNWAGASGIALGTIAVMLMSLVRTAHPVRAFLLGWTQPEALLGLLAGAFFAVAAVGFRAASISLRDPSPFLAASFTLVVATLLQTLVMGVFLAIQEPGQLRRVAAEARTGALAGLASFVGSAGWFTAFTLQIAAYVRTLGLVELAFTLLISRYVFRERPTRAELLGLALLAVSIALVLNSGR